MMDAFDEPGNSFNPERYDIKKKMFGAKQMVLYVPTEQGRVTVMIYRSTGRAQMQGPPMEACAEAAKKINQQLYKYGARGVKFDDELISQKSPMQRTQARPKLSPSADRVARESPT